MSSGYTFDEEHSRIAQQQIENITAVWETKHEDVPIMVAQVHATLAVASAIRDVGDILDNLRDDLGERS